MENWAIIPAYGCLDYVRAAINDLLNQDLEGVKILVIDNSPVPLDLREFTNGGDVSQVAFPENLGVGRSWNWGLRYVFGRKVEHALVVNQDVRLRYDTYRLLMEPLGGFVTGVGVHTPEEVAFGSLLKVGIFPKLRGGPDFSCFLIRKPFYDEVGPFDECFYPGYREDNSYHWRAKCRGLSQSIFSVNVPYLHIGGGSSAIKSSPELRALNAANWEKNGKLYEAMWGGPPGREVFTVPYGVGESPYVNQRELPSHLL